MNTQQLYVGQHKQHFYIPREGQQPSFLQTMQAVQVFDHGSVKIRNTEKEHT